MVRDTLVKAPADPKAPVTVKRTPASAFWQALDSSDGVTKAGALFREAKRRSKRVSVPRDGDESRRLRTIAGRLDEGGVAIFQLNVEAYPNSANAQDSLGDGYLADGQKELALAAAKKCLAMLAADTSPEEFKKAIRQSAEDKIAKLQ